MGGGRNSGQRETASEPHGGAPFYDTAPLSKVDEVVLVNEKDEVIGTQQKINAHLLGALHRAFSIFIFNSKDQLLLQKRTTTKYHSRGLWSNTCCGHPRLGESTEEASRRRLAEEMGFDCDVRAMFSFVYYTALEDGLYEHEYDHVLVGKFDGTPNPNKDEVDEWKWIDLATLRLGIQENPENYTYWFRIALGMFFGRAGILKRDSAPNGAGYCLKL